jgi:hypothetical protein
MNTIIQSQKEVLLGLPEHQRKGYLLRIAAIDGVGDYGLFYITAQTPDGHERKVVVTTPFLDKKMKKLKNSKLFRIGAPVITKPAEGLITQKRVAGNMGRYTVMGNYKNTYTDLCAVLTEAEEAEWTDIGLF